MKKIYSLFTLLCLSVFFAGAQPIINEGSTASNAICNSDTLEWYRIITPVNGQLEIFTTAWVADTINPAGQRLGIEVLGRNNNISFGTFYPRIGTNSVGALDTFYTIDGSAGLAVDTFYFRIDNSFAFLFCFYYEISWKIIPATYPISAQPDSFPGAPQPMPYNTNVTGNLGYNDGLREGENGTNDWRIIPPMDGTLKINLSIEALNGSFMSVIPYDHNLQGFVAAQYPATGAFHAPIDTVIYWDCISGGDTFYIETALDTYGDDGYSYQMSYTMVPPVYNDDIEPNNSFAQAQVVNPAIPIEGHLSFYGETDDDYFEFRKPDSGFLQIQALIESAETVGAGAYMYVNVFDSAQNDIYSFYPYIGGNSQPVLSYGYVANLPPGLYYIQAESGSNCTSYRFDISTPTITGTHSVSATPPALNIFPNPSSGVFTIDFGNMTNATISVYNTIGQLVETTLQQNERYVVLGKELPAGLYLVKASNSNGEIVSQGKLSVIK